MDFSRQDYWSELPFFSPGDLPNPGIEPWSPAFQADALPSEPPGNPIEIQMLTISVLKHRISNKGLDSLFSGHNS